MTQIEQILDYLQAVKSKGMTALDALEVCGCFRLAARIHTLRGEGHNILTQYETRNGKNYARYTLIESTKNATT